MSLIPNGIRHRAQGAGDPSTLLRAGLSMVLRAGPSTLPVSSEVERLRAGGGQTRVDGS
jgi:hypothetical protein